DSPGSVFCDSFFLSRRKEELMGRPHPIELRSRVVDRVEEGHSHRSTAAHFRVSVRFVNDMVKLKRETGSLAPKRQGNPGRGSCPAGSPGSALTFLSRRAPRLMSWLSPCASSRG